MKREHQTSLWSDRIEVVAQSRTVSISWLLEEKRKKKKKQPCPGPIMILINLSVILMFH